MTDHGVFVPAHVLLCPAVCAGAKLLYGQICFLLKKNGGCCAADLADAHFAQSCSEKSIARWITELYSAGLIRCDGQRRGMTITIVAPAARHPPAPPVAPAAYIPPPPAAYIAPPPAGTAQTRAADTALLICAELWLQYCYQRAAVRPTWPDAREEQALKLIIAIIIDLAAAKLRRDGSTPRAISEITVCGVRIALDRIARRAVAEAEMDPLARQTCEVFAYILSSTDRVTPFFTANMTLCFFKNNLISILNELRNGSPSTNKKSGFSSPTASDSASATEIINSPGYRPRY